MKHPASRSVTTSRRFSTSAALAVALCLVSSASAAIDIYVAKDGDDTKDGLTRATAKATIPAAYAAMTNGLPEQTYGNRLVVGDGVWTSAEIGQTLVLSNGWVVTSENGSRATTIKAVKSTLITFFRSTSSDVLIDGITFDFARQNYRYVDGGVVSHNSLGTISNCRIVGWYTGWNNSFLKMTASGKHITFKGCEFSNCNGYYRNSVLWTEKGGTMDLIDCIFVDCKNASSYFTYGIVHFKTACTVRNCLFKGCAAYKSDGKYGWYSGVLTIESGAKATVESCSFINCTVSAGGGALGGMTLSGNGGTVRNCLAYGCVNNTGTAGFGLMPGMTYENCADEKELAGTGNIVLTDANVVWQCAAEGRYIPVSGPTIDAASEQTWMTSATDVRGKSRINGAGPDIGCYEYHKPNVYYVSKVGNDANDGLTPATAKATLAAGYALLSAEDESLVLGEGVWTSKEIGPTLVLSNGWTLVGTPGKTVIKKTECDAVPYTLATAGASLRDITVEEYAGTTYYVEKDGDDANDGLTPQTAKATIPAAYAAMTNGIWNQTYGNRLVVGDGVWTSTEIGMTLVLSNGWSLVGKNGRAMTVLKAASDDFVFFNQLTSDTTVRGISFDFAGKTYSVFAVENPMGTVADCEFRNYSRNSTAGNSSMIGVGLDEVTCSPAITNCVFRNIFNTRNGASVMFGTLYAKNVMIRDSAFIDCVSGTSNNSGGGVIYFYRSTGTVRNCLFLRAKVYGAKAATYGSRAGVVSVGTSSGNMTVENCTFVGCQIHQHKTAGCVCLGGENAKLYVRNCLAYDNIRVVNGEISPANLITNLTSGGTLSYTYCANDTAINGDGNVVLTDTNFRFRSPSRGDYAVMWGPPVNGGTILAWMTGAKDLKGRDRVIGASVDIGCFEYDFKAGTTVTLR